MSTPGTLVALLALTLIATAFGCAPGLGGGAVGAEAEPPAPSDSEDLKPLVLEAPSKTVSFAIGFSAGSADDPAGKEGLTALTAALIAEGGTKTRSRARVLEELFPMAASVDYTVDRDRTTFTARVHVDHLEKFWTVFREMLLAPGLRADDFERLRDRARAALTLRLRTGDDEELGKAVLQAAMYEGQPYAHPPVGTVSGLAGIQLADVAAQRARVLCRERLTIGLAGGVPERFPAAVEAALKALPHCTTPRAPRATAAAPERTTAWIVDKPTADSTAISFGFPIDVNRDHPDYAALYLAVSWLGQHRNSVSHLFKKIREERGLNYGDYAYIEWWPAGGRTTLPPVHVVRDQQFFHVWIRPVPLEAGHFALRAAVRELTKLVESGISQQAFDDHKRFLTHYVSFYTITEERRLGYAMDDDARGLDEPSLEALRAAWATMTREEMQAAVRRHLRPDRLRIAVVTRGAAAFADQLAEGRPSPITYASEKPAAVLEEDTEIETFPVPLQRSDIRVLPLDELFE